ncbi:nucleolar and spindle-associated protein 1 [Lepisosteus oculatus]|uniref:nucleolar and spindle-associated protein 1 n=1 Tax=Lepisosteus oculatus TaxID=7918 RepID=UPI00371F5B3E
MDLDSMKYAELQRLAKDVGLKANMKAEKLLKALKEHFEQQDKGGTTEKENEVSTDSASSENLNVSEGEPDQKTFVTKRRGRGRQPVKRRKQQEEEEEEESTGEMGKATSPLNKPESTPQASEEPQVQPKALSSGKRRRLTRAEEVRSAETAVQPPDTAQVPQPQSSDKPKRAEKDDGTTQADTRQMGKIPRHEGLMKRMGKAVLKPTTPNFKKLHEAHFSKMESIDSYVQRKNKQIEAYKSSVNEVKMLSEKANILKLSDKRTPSTLATKPSAGRVSLFSPNSKDRRPTTSIPSPRRRPTQTSASKPALREASSFKPVLSARRINVRFSEATKDNEHKRSLVKTPARKSPYTVAESSTPGAGPAKRATSESNKPGGPASHSKVQVTPFVFKGDANTSISDTPGTNVKKNAFDLKASLARPLSYQPHKGKLKPFGVIQENAPLLNKSQNSHQNNYKQHPVQTREERRTLHTKDRKQKKDKLLGTRRGLVLN